MTVNDLNLFSQLVNDYKILIKSRLVTQEVAVKLHLTPEQTESLPSKINVGSKENTRHIIITVTDENPKMAKDIANTVSDVFAVTVVEKMGISNVQIIDRAVLPQSPSSPHTVLNILFGFVLGFLLASGIVFLIDIFDTAIRSADDVIDLTGYTLLGTIPDFKNSHYHSRGRRA